ncbi:Uncharacterised protein [Mycobacterium tuberculosis]|nr:Uncharacterised protein [Mycobacterium tuberculosis]
MRRFSEDPSPPTASDASCSTDATRSLGSTANPRLAASSAGPIWLGTVVVVIVCPCRRYGPLVRVDTRSTNCSPTADTECTLAEASVGIW